MSYIKLFFSRKKPYQFFFWDKALSHFNFYLCLDGESLEIVKYGDTVEIDCFEPDLANQHTDAFISLHIALPNAKPNEIVQYKVINLFVNFVSEIIKIH